MRKRKPKESQTVTIAPEPQPKPSKNSTFARTKAQQEKALANFPDRTLIHVTETGECIYPPGCADIFDALSAFESRRANERAEQLQSERAKQYELAKGTEQRKKPRALSDCKKVLQKPPQHVSQEIKNITHTARQSEEMPPLKELTRAWRKSGCKIPILARLYEVKQKTAKNWLMKAGLIPSKTYGKEAK